MNTIEIHGITAEKMGYTGDARHFSAPAAARHITDEVLREMRDGDESDDVTRALCTTMDDVHGRAVLIIRAAGDETTGTEISSFNDAEPLKIASRFVESFAGKGYAVTLKPAEETGKHS